MFGIGNVFNPATIFGSMLGGPLGAILAQALQQVVSQVVQEIIQKAGQQLGLPQSFIDIAQGAAAGSLGDSQGATRNLQEAISGFASATGATGAAAGALQREATDFTSNFVQDAVNKIVKESGDTAASASSGQGIGGSSAAAGGKGGSVLMRIALAIGEALDKKVDQMAANADRMADLDPQGSGKAPTAQEKKEFSEYNRLSAEMNALGQEVKIVSAALDNALKSIGDASSALARRQ